MIDPNKYYIVVNQRASLKSGLSPSEICDRICRGTSTIKQVKDYIPDQPTFAEDDGKGWQWIASITDRPSPAKNLKMAYVVNAHVTAPTCANA